MEGETAAPLSSAAPKGPVWRPGVCGTGRGGHPKLKLDGRLCKECPKKEVDPCMHVCMSMYEWVNERTNERMTMTMIEPIRVTDRSEGVGRGHRDHWGIRFACV